MDSNVFSYDNIVSMTTKFLMNFGVAIPQFAELVRVSMWIIGLLLMISAILKLRTFRDPGKERIVSKCLWQMFFAFLCLNINVALDSATMTVFAQSTSPLSYPTSGGGWANERISLVAHVVLIWIEFVGYIAFARGILILNRVKTKPEARDISIGKGLTHIIGGVLCCNLSLFADYLM